MATELVEGPRPAPARPASATAKRNASVLEVVTELEPVATDLHQLRCRYALKLIALVDLADTAEGATDILDRIERAIGITQPADQAPSPVHLEALARCAEGLTWLLPQLSFISNGVPELLRDLINTVENAL